MTEEQAHALGKRLVACRHFRPLRGMLDLQSRTWDASLLWRWNSDVDVPDLRDAATRGVLLELVRLAWDDPALYALPTFRGEGDWHVLTKRGLWSGETEAEALVASIEAAP